MIQSLPAVRYSQDTVFLQSSGQRVNGINSDKLTQTTPGEILTQLWPQMLAALLSVRSDSMHVSAVSISLTDVPYQEAFRIHFLHYYSAFPLSRHCQMQQLPQALQEAAAFTYLCNYIWLLSLVCKGGWYPGTQCKWLCVLS